MPEKIHMPSDHEFYEKKQIVVKPPLVYERKTLECRCGQVKSMILKVLMREDDPKVA
jgi:hypothetical protein